MVENIHFILFSCCKSKKTGDPKPLVDQNRLWITGKSERKLFCTIYLDSKPFCGTLVSLTWRHYGRLYPRKLICQLLRVIFFSNSLNFRVNFPVLYKYKNMELTLKKIWIWTAMGCVFGDFSLDFPWFGLVIYKLQTLHFWTRMTFGRSSLDFHFSWPI